jgi:hypothetical protein
LLVLRYVLLHELADNVRGTTVTRAASFDERPPKLPLDAYAKAGILEHRI